jgi:hypothetical protein
MQNLASKIDQISQFYEPRIQGILHQKKSRSLHRWLATFRIFTGFFSNFEIKFLNFEKYRATNNPSSKQIFCYLLEFHCT